MPPPWISHSSAWANRRRWWWCVSGVHTTHFISEQAHNDIILYTEIGGVQRFWLAPEAAAPNCHARKRDTHQNHHTVAKPKATRVPRPHYDWLTGRRRRVSWKSWKNGTDGRRRAPRTVRANDDPRGSERNWGDPARSIGGKKTTGTMPSDIVEANYIVGRATHQI